MGGYNSSWWVAIGIGILALLGEHILPARIRRHYRAIVVALGILSILVGAVGLGYEYWQKYNQSAVSVSPGEVVFNASGEKVGFVVRNNSTTDLYSVGVSLKGDVQSKLPSYLKFAQAADLVPLAPNGNLSKTSDIVALECLDFSSFPTIMVYAAKIEAGGNRQFQIEFGGSAPARVTAVPAKYSDKPVPNYEGPGGDVRLPPMQMTENLNCVGGSFVFTIKNR